MDEYTLQAITEIQRQLYGRFGKTDAHYKEGYGVIFVPYMAELKNGKRCLCSAGFNYPIKEALI